MKSLLLVAAALLALVPLSSHSHPGSKSHRHPTPREAGIDPFTQPSIALTQLPVFLGARATGVTPLDWYTADMHIHATGCRPTSAPTSTTQFLKDELVRAGTNVGDILIWGDMQSWVVDAPKFLGHQDDPLSDASTILHWDMEISLMPGANFGHQTHLNLKDPNLFKPPQSDAAVEGPPYPNYPGKDYLLPNYDWAHAQQAVVGYPHAQDWEPEVYDPKVIKSSIAPRELPLDVMMKKVDFLATEYVHHANYLWLWYNMLNSGIHLAPAAGSDYPCYEGTIGRVQTLFAFARGTKLTFPGYIDAVRKGRTVIRENPRAPVTDAPGSAEFTEYLDMRVSGRELGAEITIPSSEKKVVVEIDASGSAGNKIGLVKNGKIIAIMPISPALTTYTFEVPMDRSGWLAALTTDAHTAATFVLMNGCDIRLDPKAASNWSQYLKAFAEYAAPNLGKSKLKALADIKMASLAWQKIAEDGYASKCVARVPR